MVLINRTVLRFSRYAGGWLVLVVVATLASSAAAIAAAFSLVTVVAELLAGDPGSILTPLAWTATFTALRLGLLWVRDQAATAAGIAVKTRLRSALVRHLFTLGPSWSAREETGSIQASVADGVEHLQAYIGFYLPQLIASVVVPAALVGILATRDVEVALVVAVGIVTVPLAQRLWRRLLGKRATEHWDAYSAYAARISDSINGIQTLAALGAAQRQGRRLVRDAEELRRATNANLRASLGVSVVTAATMSLGTAGATVLAAFHAAEGRLQPTDVLLVLFLAAECFRPLQELQNYWHEGFYGIAASLGIGRILDARPSVTDHPGSRSIDLSRAPSIRLESIGFTYPGAAVPALRDVSFDVPAGATLAIVGPSGAGKSTLVQLLLRDLDPDEGDILVAGTALRDIELAQLRRASARVSQDVVLLSGSIAENIRYANPEATEEQLAAAVAGARVDEFTRELPAGLDTHVGERGSRLSGGQRQRVALARALLSNAPILVLDEATSALDAENEALITAALRDAMDRRDRTIVVIAHRLSTVASADLIAVLDEGRLVEFGPPGRLAGEGGPWSRMLAAQRSALTVAGGGS